MTPTRTVVSSATKTVLIGFDQPFCVIGERINPTGRKKLAAELEAGDFSTVEADALEQVACGATMLDVNSGAVFTNRMAEDPRYADIYKLQRKIGKDTGLARSLWITGNHDARTLATLIVEPRELSREELIAWIDAARYRLLNDAVSKVAAESAHGHG